LKKQIFISLGTIMQRQQNFCEDVLTAINVVKAAYLLATSQYGYQSPGWNPEQKIKVDYINHNEEANNIKMLQTYQNIFFTDLGYFKF